LALWWRDSRGGRCFDTARPPRRAAAEEEADVRTLARRTAGRR
jgi:hypothetical protein